MGKLLLAVLFVGVLAFGADQAVTMVAERRAAEELESNIGAPTTVDLQGWPVSLGLLSGEIASAVVQATSVPVPDLPVTLPRVDVDVTDVRLPHASSGDGSTIQAGSGRFTARLDQPTVTDIVAAYTDLGTVQITSDTVQVVVNGVAVDLDVGARDGQIVASPRNDLLAALVGGEVTLPLQGLPVGMSIDDVRVEAGEVLISGPVDVNQLLAGVALRG